MSEQPEFQDKLTGYMQQVPRAAASSKVILKSLISGLLLGLIVNQLASRSSSSIYYQMQLDLHTKSVTFATGKDVIIDQNLIWTEPHDLCIISGGHIIIKHDVHIRAGGHVTLMAGNEHQVIFESYSLVGSSGGVTIYEFPRSYKSHRYDSDIDAMDHIVYLHRFKHYWWVCSVFDLMNIRTAPGDCYALYDDIDASPTSYTYNGHGFLPVPKFTGELDGRHHTISNLYMSWPNDDLVGIFNRTVGCNQVRSPIHIRNLKFKDCYIRGKRYVGLLAGTSQFTTFTNLHLANVTVVADEIAGGVLGTAFYSTLVNVSTTNVTAIARECFGELVGVDTKSDVQTSTNTCVS